MLLSEGYICFVVKSLYFYISDLEEKTNKGSGNTAPRENGVDLVKTIALRRRET